VDENSDITEQLDELEKAVGALAHRMYPYMVSPIPVAETVAPAPHPRSPVYDRIGGVINHLRDLNARLVP
jgi:hypothetical protein